MLSRLLGSELISWKYIRTEQIIAFLGVGLIMFLALCAFLAAKCIHSQIVSSASDIQIQAFWKSDQSMDHVRQAWEDARQLRSVHSISTFTPAQALKQMQDDIGQNVELSWLTDKNPLPPTAVVQANISQNSTASELVRQIEALPGVDRVHSNPLEVHAAESWRRIALTIVWPLITVLLLTQAVILANTVRLSLNRLHEDILVLRLIGATRWACQAPILFRMLALTFAGTTLALGGLKLVQIQALEVLSSPPFHWSCPFLSGPEILAAFLCASAVTGLSSVLAIRSQGL
ncbi:MAG: permease-like cell division protein FtsX [Desulfovermiculus sp.]